VPERAPCACAGRAPGKVAQSRRPNAKTSQSAGALPSPPSRMSCVAPMLPLSPPPAPKSSPGRGGRRIFGGRSAWPEARRPAGRRSARQARLPCAARPVVGWRC